MTSHGAKRRWSELSGGQRAGAVAAGVVQLGLLVAALADLRRRPAAEVRGNKKLWTAACFVNFAGPLAYFWVRPPALAATGTLFRIGNALLPPDVLRPALGVAAAKPSARRVAQRH